MSLICSISNDYHQQWSLYKMASVSPHKQEMEGKAITSLLLLGNKCGAYLELVMKSFCI